MSEANKFLFSGRFKDFIRLNQKGYRLIETKTLKPQKEFMIDLTNKSNIPTKKLIKLIEFSFPKRTKICPFIFKNTVDPYSGAFHFGNYAEPFIIIRIGDKKHFPLEFKLRSDKILRTGYAGAYSLIDRDSALVFCTCHEARHMIQIQDEKMKFWLYHDMKSAENDADAYAFKKLRKFHKLRELGLNPLK